MILTLLFLFSATLTQAAEPGYATIDQRLAIKEHLRAGFEARKIFLDAVEAEKGLRADALRSHDFTLWERWETKELEKKAIETQMNEEFRLFFFDTAFYYGFLPDEGVIADGPLAGKAIAWSAQLYDEEEHYRKIDGPHGPLYVKIRKNDDETKLQAGFIKDDGGIGIRLGELKKTLESGDIGLFASKLYHETVHYERMVGSGAASLQEYELEAYGKQVEYRAAFGIPEDSEEAKFTLSQKAYYEAEVEKLKTNPKLIESGFTPEDIILQYRYRIAWEDAEKLRKDIQSEANTLKDNLKKARAARDRQAEKKKSEEVEARFKNLLVRIDIEAQRCGFEALNLENARQYGFRQSYSNSPRKIDYYHKWDTDLDGVKMDLFLARACHDSQSKFGTYKMEKPCNDAFDVMRRRWDEPEFRNRLELRVTGRPGQEQCLLYLKDHLDPAGGLDNLNQELREGWNRIYTESEASEAKRREAEERNRQGNGNNEAPHTSPQQPDEENSEREPRRSYNGPCGNGGSLCGSNRPRFP